MKSFVIDASVALKWLLSNEPDSERAQAIRQRLFSQTIRVLAPEIWVYEVGNFLSRMFPAEGTAFLEDLLNSGVELAALDQELRKQSFQLAARCGATFYDSAYHALARRNGATFITADEKYYRKAKAAGNIQLLCDYE